MPQKTLEEILELFLKLDVEYDEKCRKLGIVRRKLNALKDPIIKDTLEKEFAGNIEKDSLPFSTEKDLKDEYTLLNQETLVLSGKIVMLKWFMGSKRI